MARQGCGVFAISSMLMADNMRDAEALVRLAYAWRVNIAFSGYNDLKNANSSHFVSPAQLAEFRALCRRLKQLKRDLGNVLTSDYFFDTLPEFYLHRQLPGCNAGKTMIHVSPTGMGQPCAELPPICHYTEFVPGSYRGRAAAPASIPVAPSPRRP